MTASEVLKDSKLEKYFAKVAKQKEQLEFEREEFWDYLCVLLDIVDKPKKKKAIKKFVELMKNSDSVEMMECGRKPLISFKTGNIPSLV